MKKIILISILAIFSLTIFSQPVITGKGTVSSPLLIVYSATKDTSFFITANPVSSSGVFSIYDHWTYASGQTSKVIPIESPDKQDSTSLYMAFDTTKCVIATQAYNRRNIGFGAQFTSGVYLGLQFRMVGVSKVNHRIKVIFK